ncbi:carbohydrate ABC transporter substrate-binding protein [Oxalobacteraceae bacterium]|nr:carbohydrate ABC transporter substrate-binding protein [Oxalobacteraceae bacterium]
MMQKHHKRLALFISLALAGLCQAQAQDKTIDVVHWWTSGSEGAALKVLRDDMGKRGFQWKDGAVSGGGGEPARAVLRTRLAANNPPDVMQMIGFSIPAYADDGTLGNVDALAAEQGWDKVVPPQLQKFAKHKNHWNAVPLGVHRTNWIWANKAIFDELKLAPPKTFEELVSMADKIRKAGYIPLAHGGQAWQSATLFDSAVLSVGGAKFYKEALIDLDPKALSGKTMEKAFEQLAQLRTMVDPAYPNREWNFATSMVYHKKAAMQIMGDWAKGEFEKARMKPGTDYLCFQYPGTDGAFIFGADQFGILNTKQQAAQVAFASAAMDKGVQEKFNIIKGSIPARTDVPMDNFDSCGKKSMADMKQAIKSNTMVGSFAHGHAMRDTAKVAATEVVGKFFDKGGSPAEAAQQLAAAIAKAK